MMSPLHVPVDSFEKVVHQGSIGVGGGEKVEVYNPHFVEAKAADFVGR